MAFYNPGSMSKVCCLQKRFAADVLSAPLNPEALREPLICPPGQYHDALQKKDERIKLRQWPYLQCHEPPPELHQPFSDVSLGSFRCLWLDWRSGVLRKKWKDRNDIKICFQFNLVCAVSLDLGTYTKKQLSWKCLGQYYNTDIACFLWLSWPLQDIK